MLSISRNISEKSYPPRRNVIQQGNLHDYFASDLILEKNTEKPSSMKSLLSLMTKS